MPHSNKSRESFLKLRYFSTENKITPPYYREKCRIDVRLQLSILALEIYERNFHSESHGWRRSGAKKAGWNTGDNFSIGYIARDDRTGANHRGYSDLHAGHDDRTRSDARTATDVNGFHFPGVILCCLHRRMAIVDKHHTMADKHFVFDYHPGANKCMTLNTTTPAYDRIALNLDKSADARIVSDGASI
jgi:hypothetical protein